MLKTTILFLFGCSLYYGQSIATAPSNSQANTTGCANCPVDLNKDTDGTRVKNSSGEGSGTSPFAIIINQPAKNDLSVYLMPAEVQFTKFTIYDLSGNVKKTQQISPTNSYSIDVSNLIPGNYLIKVEAVSSAIVTKLFVRI